MGRVKLDPLGLGRAGYPRVGFILPSLIVEGGFERSVLPAAWERWIGDVGGEMGFAGVRVGFALVDRVQVELEVGGGEVE